MSPVVSVLRATPADIDAFAPLMRPADAAEVMRSGGLTPRAALEQSVAATAPRVWTVRFDGEPVAMCGISSVDLVGTVAVPWLLTGQGAGRHPREFLRLARSVANAWADEFPVLFQYVDEEYASAHRFLRALGFTLYPPVAYGVAGALFRPAIRSRPCATP